MTRLERSIALVLRAGVFGSSSALAIGLALWLAGAAGPGELFLRIGIVVLLCTPIARVVISTVEYSAARDWTFAALTAVVLLELMASVVAALVFNRRL